VPETGFPVSHQEFPGLADESLGRKLRQAKHNPSTLRESGKKKGFLFLIGSVSFLLWAAAVAQNDNFNTENDDFLHQLREDVQTNPYMIIDVYRNIRDPLTLPRGVVLVNHSQGYPLLASK